MVTFHSRRSNSVILSSSLRGPTEAIVAWEKGSLWQSITRFRGALTQLQYSPRGLSPEWQRSLLPAPPRSSRSSRWQQDRECMRPSPTGMPHDTLPVQPSVCIERAPHVVLIDCARGWCKINIALHHCRDKMQTASKNYDSFCRASVELLPNQRQLHSRCQVGPTYTTIEHLVNQSWVTCNGARVWSTVQSLGLTHHLSTSV